MPEDIGCPIYAWIQQTDKFGVCKRTAGTSNSLEES